MLGVIGILVVAVVTAHCCTLIVRCKHTALTEISRGTAVKDSELLAEKFQYGDVAVAALGPKGRTLVDIFLFITQFGFCVGYFIFLGTTITKISKGYISVEVSIVVMFVVETLLSMIRDLRRLSIASMVANIALLFGYFAVLSHEISTFTIAVSLQYFNWATFLRRGNWFL